MNRIIRGERGASRELFKYMIDEFRRSVGSGEDSMMRRYLDAGWNPFNGRDKQMQLLPGFSPEVQKAIAPIFEEAGEVLE